MYNKISSNHFVREESDNNSSENYSPEHSGDSPSSAMAKHPKIATKIRRATVGKKVISVPIKDMERLRLKGDHVSAPPSDSWAWRKYGQKPIKGSPYPRGYYRCSSSKTCAARKQVERSRADPNMLIVTYSSDHNHPPPSSRNLHHRHPPSAAAASTSVSEEESEEEEEEEKARDFLDNQSQEINSDNRFSNINSEGNWIDGGEFGWLAEFESTSGMILESPINLMEERGSTEREMAKIFSMREGEEYSDLFADLGVLPECSTVGWRSNGGVA